MCKQTSVAAYIAVTDLTLAGDVIRSLTIEAFFPLFRIAAICFMSAPHAKHGSPTKEQLLSIVDQLAECGVLNVGVTGGEPLIREDLFDILDALSAREIGVSTLYTNGWLVDEALLDKLAERNMHPSFQLSFDGVGWHDFLRGMPCAEEKAIHAFELLRERNFPMSASVCIHRKSRESLRDTVKLLASLGVMSVKCGSMMEIGEWASPEVRGLQLTRQEELEMFEHYIPQYFEDDAPVSIMMSDTLMYTPGDEEWRIYDVREVPAEYEDSAPSCGVLSRSFYTGADGMVAPCMGTCDCSYATNFPNLFETPLRDILRESTYTELTRVSVGVKHHENCRIDEGCDQSYQDMRRSLQSEQPW